ncbi:MAG TPA: AarF/UbiB family protein [Myxococcota bacterium]|nr:AarF/UbiB family protein [Myxococcota bacterium]
MKSIHVQDLGRIRSIAQVLARNGFGQLLGRVDPDLAASEPDGASTAPYARRLRRVLVELGPTFVKLGQVLSLRPDILPRDVMLEFQRLQHEVDPMSEEDCRAVLADELPLPLHEVFAAFDFTPIGAASIAQVHAAQLVTGERVAVKLQRRGIEPVIRSDIHILYTLASLVEGRLAIPGMYTPTAIVREFDEAMAKELDFIQEARATERMARVIAGTTAVVPAIHPRWTTRRVMVMDRIDGAPLAACFDALDVDQRRRIAHELMEVTYRQVFDHGFFHGDPHPGNLLVTRDGHLALLDFGVTGLLTGSMQETVLQTFTAMVFRDADSLAQTIYRAGATRDRIDLREFRAALERKMVEYYGASLDDLAQRDTLVEVVEMATRFRINLPAEFAVLSRALALVEGNLRRLLPDVDIVAEVRPWAERLVQRRFSPDRLGQDAVAALLRLQGPMRDLPSQVSQTLLDLEAGRLTLVTHDPDAAALREEIRRATRRLSLAALVGTAGTGAVLYLDAPGAWLGVNVRDVVGTSLVALALSAFAVLFLELYLPGALDPSRWRRFVWRVWQFFRRGSPLD